MTNQTKFFFSILLALSLFLIQMEGVSAAPGLQNQSLVGGIVQSITLEADTITGVTLVSIDVLDTNQAIQTVRVSLETAIAQGLVVLNGDGKPVINNAALGKQIEIDPSSIIPIRQETQHPVGSALATFFADIAGLDYETIMMAHEQGVGFGLIAQSLWLTTKLEGDAEIFNALIEARQTGDYSAFVLEDGSSPENWGQLRQAILDNDQNNSVGVIMSNQDNNGNGTGQGNNGNDSGNNNGNGHGNNRDNENGQGNNRENSENGNGNNKEKDKKK
jgi:hypothetical protein